MSDSSMKEARLQEWGGGTLPYSIPHIKLGMWLFIVSDALTFSGLLIAYAYLRVATPEWPTPFHLWPTIAMASLMTFVLLSSSLTMVLGVNAAQRDDRKWTVLWTLFTALGGIAAVLISYSPVKEAWSVGGLNILISLIILSDNNHYN